MTPTQKLVRAAYENLLFPPTEETMRQYLQTKLELFEEDGFQDPGLDELREMTKLLDSQGLPALKKHLEMES